MSDYIERSKLAKATEIWRNQLIEIYGENDEYVKCLDSVLLGIDNIPAADVRPVVRGKWIEPRFSENVYGVECSVCHTTWDYGTNFCPYCGSYMEL